MFARMNAMSIHEQRFDCGEAELFTKALAAFTQLRRAKGRSSSTRAGKDFLRLQPDLF
jgi:hypothetical protein